MHRYEIEPRIRHAVEEVVERAKLYLKWGLTPVPIKPGLKSPFGIGWANVSREDSLAKFYGAGAYFTRVLERKTAEVGEDYADGVRRLSRGEIGLNAGIICGEASGVIVLDIDARGGGVRRWETATRIFGSPDTFTVRTGSGGLHVYFRYEPQIAHLSTSRDSLGTGWDIRSNRGQVLGPYSIHPTTGKAYEPIAGMVDGRPHFSSMPHWLFEPYDVFEEKLRSIVEAAHTSTSGDPTPTSIHHRGST